MLHANAGPGALSFVRTVVLGLWLGIIVATPLHLLAVLPSEIINPPGVFQLLPHEWWELFMAKTSLTVFRWALVVVIGILIVGWVPFPGFPLLAGLGILFFDAALKSVGEFINHARFALIYITIFLCAGPRSYTTFFAQRGRGSAIDSGSVLRLGTLVIAAAYSLIGVYRLTMGGVSIFVGDSLPTYVMARSLEPSGYSFQYGLNAVGSHWGIVALKAGFFATTLAEVASPLCLISNNVRRSWLAIMSAFHVMTLLTMNILFWENLVLIVLFFTELPTVLAVKLSAIHEVDAALPAHLSN